MGKVVIYAIDCRHGFPTTTPISAHSARGDISQLSKLSGPAGAGGGIHSQAHREAMHEMAAVAARRRERKACWDCARKHVVELLSFSVEHHGHRIKYYMLRNNVMQAVTHLLSEADKHLVLTALKFLRQVRSPSAPPLRPLLLNLLRPPSPQSSAAGRRIVRSGIHTRAHTPPRTHSRAHTHEPHIFFIEACIVARGTAESG